VVNSWSILRLAWPEVLGIVILFSVFCHCVSEVGVFGFGPGFGVPFRFWCLCVLLVFRCLAAADIWLHA